VSFVIVLVFSFSLSGSPPSPPLGVDVMSIDSRARRDPKMGYDLTVPFTRAPDSAEAALTTISLLAEVRHVLAGQNEPLSP